LKSGIISNGIDAKGRQIVLFSKFKTGALGIGGLTIGGSGTFFNQTEADLKVFITLDIIGLETQGGVELFKGFFQLPLAYEGCSKVVIHFSLVRPEPYGGLKVHDRFMEFPATGQRDPKIAMGGGIFGINVKRDPEMLYGRICSALGRQGCSQIIMSLGISGI